MIKSLYARLQQGHHTTRFPDGPAPVLPDRFRGMPRRQAGRCPADCHHCVTACPTGALRTTGVDLGRCLFCSDCVTACPHQALRHDSGFRLAARRRADLIRSDDDIPPRMEPLAADLRRLFKRSLKLRQVSAGGCNACEADTNVLETLVWDLGRFGIQFMASPRHADGLLVTGPVNRNMADALIKTYAAVPPPKIVIAVGTCAISGGPFASTREACAGVDPFLPVDLYVPGCPPHPLTILDGLLRLLGLNRQAP